MGKIELKPCPFCDGADLEMSNTGGHMLWVHCKGCNASTSVQGTEEKAAEAWNTRTKYEQK